MCCLREGIPVLHGGEEINAVHNNGLSGGNTIGAVGLAPFHWGDNRAMVMVRPWHSPRCWPADDADWPYNLSPACGPGHGSC